MGENAPGIQGKLLAFLYKALFAYALYSPMSIDSDIVSEQLFNGTSSFNEKLHSVLDVNMKVKDYRVILVGTCFTGFSLLLAITVPLVLWDNHVAFMKRTLDLETGNANGGHVAVYIVSSSVWCSPLYGPTSAISLGRRQSTFRVLCFSDYCIVFVFRHGHEEDFGVTDNSKHSLQLYWKGLWSTMVYGACH